MIEVSIQDGIGTVALNRPEIHNAFNGELVVALLDAFDRLEDDDSVAVVLLRSAGRSFCAGADLAWMKSMVAAGEEENRAGALRMAGLFRRINDFPKPTLARVQGAAIGGGVGLVSCADIVVASTRARFGLSEVRLGLAPAVISPFVKAKIGESAARRYFVTGERFDAETAARLGLVHEVVPEEDLDATVEGLLGALRQGGPKALMACKGLALPNPLGGVALDQQNADLIAGMRVSDEGQEGLGAFFAKRKPAWQEGQG